MNKILRLITINKRQKLVLSVLLLSVGLVTAESFSGIQLVIAGLVLSLLTIGFLYLILRNDIAKKSYFPLFILPFLYTLAFTLFGMLIPSRVVYKLILTIIYAFGMYSLFLTQNIFAVSSIRTITLLRSARIVSFIVTIFILFLLINSIFALRIPLATPFLIFLVVFSLDFQSLWMHSIVEPNVGKQPFFHALVSGVSIMELSLVLLLWPINGSIYSLFLTGIFYMYSGLSHAWLEKRLFKSLLWEYIWVGFLAILILIFFSQWGL